MTDLRDQLQTALGSAYTIERELGGGGMSRVLVARDTALRRDVVVKVLPPELVAGVNVERFRREILVAAGLQHPHIVPVLASGEMNGLPWFTMPFVQGESLRERVARGPLPIGEVVTTLREIAKALAYAHERGVVHRDIKPDNVLLTGGTAVVTDFGIAKALSASRTDGDDPHATRGSLTQVGTSIGTPTYMAPEQAAADPNTDARADIYSFGCVAYEMLTGRPPFTGMSPQKLLAAHMGERPQDVTALRRDTPPLLGELVMRCLEKEPEHRPASAADIVRALDLVSTTSGSATAASAVLLGGRVRLRVALAVWAAIFVGAWVFAKAAIVGIGLPSWVLPGALVVAAMGLPVILFTAYVQKTAHAALMRTPTLTPGGTPSPNSTFATIAVKASPHVSWRRTTRGGVFAFGAFVAVVAAFMVLRALGIGPAGSLLAEGRISAKEPLLVTDFAVTKGDTTLSGVVSEAIRASLAESNAIRLVPAATVAGSLQRMQRAPGQRIDLTTARDIAEREGVKAIVDGEVAALGSGYVITVRLVTADSGIVLARAQKAADSPTQLIAAADAVGRDLRGRIGESLKSVQNAPALEQVTTSSIEALRLYSEGSRAYDYAGDVLTGAARLKAAVGIDSGFAMAWRKLGVVYAGGAGAFPQSMVDSALANAYHFRDRLTRREALLTVGSYFMSGPGRERARAAAAYEQLLAAGDSDVALNNYALIEQGRRHYAKAESLLVAAKRISPGEHQPQENLSLVLVDAGKATEAHASLTGPLASATAGAKGEFALDEVLVRAASADYSGAGRLTDSLLAHGDPVTRVQTFFLSGALAALHGRPSSASAKITAGLTLSDSLGVHAQPLPDTEFLAAVDVGINRPQRAVGRLDALLAAAPLRSMAESDRDYLGVATLYAQAGRADKAKAILAQRTAELRDTARLRYENNQVSGVLAEIALVEGHPADAVRGFWKADSLPDGPFSDCDGCTSFNVARAYDKAGAADSAIAYFEKSLASTFYYRLWQLDMYRASVERRLGELYETKGDKVKAAHHYQAFVDLWKDAEPDLQPQVADIRKRLARLSDTERK